MARWSDVGSRGVLLSFCKNPGLSLKRHQRSHLWAKDTVAKPTTGAKLRANHSTIDTERVREDCAGSAAVLWQTRSVAS